MVGLTLAPIPAETVAQPWWEIGLVILGAFSAVCGFLVIVWKIARPHVKTYMESLIKPLQAKADATHDQLTVNGHKSSIPTLLDRIDRLGSTVDDLSRLSHRNSRKIEDLRGTVSDYQSESARRLTEAVRQFSEQGITLHLEDPPRYGDD